MQVLTWVLVEANGVGVFAAWEKSKADPEVHLLVRYLVYWVAGVKGSSCRCSR